MTSSYANDAKAIVKSFHNGRNLSAVFQAAIDAAADQGTKLAKKQEGLSLLCGSKQAAELQQFSVLYGTTLNRLGLSGEGQITFTSWSELMPDRTIGETIDHIAAKVEKVFKENPGGLVVIHDAYAVKNATADDVFAFRVVEEALQAAKEKHPLVILAGHPSNIKKNLGKNNQRLSFGQNIGL